MRDYIHVMDLCSAHLLALQALLDGAAGARFNLGNGNGYSVTEVIEAAQHVTGHTIRQIMGERRPGDPAALVANAARARTDLNWQPAYADIQLIIEHAWKWEMKMLNCGR